MSKVNKHKGYGAILGDMIASPYEFKNRIKSRNFDFFNPECHFTDDTIMTIATMDALLHNKSYESAYKEWGNKYDGDYYGAMFKKWLKSPDGTIGNSFGNGCAMRISPIGYVDDIIYPHFLQNVLESVKTSHDHEESIALSIMLATYISLLSRDREVVPGLICCPFEYFGIVQSALKSMPHHNGRNGHYKQFDKFTSKAVDTVHIAIDVALTSMNETEAIRTCVWMGGDCDTTASMAAELVCARQGGIADIYVEYVEKNLPEDMLKILKKFNDVYT